MKKLVLLIAVLFSFLITSYETKAECPEGMGSRINQITVNGCVYNVEICYKCVNLDNILRVMVNGFSKDNPNCFQSWSHDQVMQYIFNTVYDLNYIRNYVCNDLPPCSTPPAPPTGVEVWLIKAVCWCKVRIDPMTIKYVVCEGSSNCIAKWLVCWDAQAGVARSFLVDGPELDYPSTCPTTGEPIQDPVGIGEFSTCWTVPTLCD